MTQTTLRGRPPKSPSLLDLFTQSMLAAQQRQQEASKGDLVRYATDPVAFVRECFVWKDDQGPASYQEEVLAAIPREGRVVVRSPRGVGKTSLAAWSLLWFALTSEALETPWKIVTTAGGRRQLERYLWPEVWTWVRRLRWEKLGRRPFLAHDEAMTMGLRLVFGEAFAVASDDPNLVEGAHAERLFYIYDEAKSIVASMFDASEGAFASPLSTPHAAAYALVLSTPGVPAGRFYELSVRKSGYQEWWSRTITVVEAIEAGRFNREWAEQRKQQWGESSPLYKNQVLGAFGADDEDGVIPLDWVEAAQRRWEEWEAKGKPRNEHLPVVYGVDVARSGKDETAIATKRGNVVETVRRFHQQDTMATTGEVVALLRKDPGDAVIDVVGLGAGVYDRLAEQSFAPIAFNAAERAPDRDRSGELEFLNKRSWAWWRLRELLDPTYDSVIALPPSEHLLEDLVAPRWKRTSSGRIQVEEKDAIRKRLGRSPDEGDAVVMAVVGAEAPIEVRFY